jgi:aminopeptidase N
MIYNAELAHQWFGNLVTMDWWNELWLNEGFATWVGWLAVDHFYPGNVSLERFSLLYELTFLKYAEWNVWSQFVVFIT